MAMARGTAGERATQCGSKRKVAQKIVRRFSLLLPFAEAPGVNVISDYRFYFSRARGMITFH
jgi:hypothetical protein